MMSMRRSGHRAINYGTVIPSLVHGTLVHSVRGVVSHSVMMWRTKEHRHARPKADWTLNIFFPYNAGGRTSTI
jgi:hypothetical protein